jgi:hypothetical protein
MNNLGALPVTLSDSSQAQGRQGGTGSGLAPGISPSDSEAS